MKKVLRIHPDDTLVVALEDLHPGDVVTVGEESVVLTDPVPAKHKFTRVALDEGDVVTLYGVPVGKTLRPLARGAVVTVDNIRHHTAAVPDSGSPAYVWNPPDVTTWAGRTFRGIVRDDGRVGTANYWLIMPMVFCENKHAEKLCVALERSLGYADTGLETIAAAMQGRKDTAAPHAEPPFPGIDGIRCLSHNGGCGGTPADALSLCEILAAYADHPNVGGVTVLALGCEKSEISLFKEALFRRNPNFDKPCLVFTEQEWTSSSDMLAEALRQTLACLPEINTISRRDVPLSHLKIGLKCGGSDGFSGITANPCMGLVSDMIIALGGAAALSEFPELCGVEGNLAGRCVSPEVRTRFLDLMRAFESTANFFGTTLADNPGPGNIRDGLVTDAIKSAGAAQKGGSAPVRAVCDYGEPMAERGLSLVCGPGNDLEVVSALVAAGCTLVMFSTGLGTPAGNAIVPVLKLATNSATALRHAELIDFDCGPILDDPALEPMAEALLGLLVRTADGAYQAKADRNGQYDFLFWKRQTSL